MEKAKRHGEEERKAFAQQVLHLNKTIPGGLATYTATAKQRLQESA